jgi:hypothetical protein
MQKAADFRRVDAQCRCLVTLFKEFCGWLRFDRSRQV